MCLSGARPIGRDTGLAEIEATAESLLGEPLGALTGSWRELNLLDEWAEHVISFVDRDVLRPLKVVADTANGMGGLVVPTVFSRLPFSVEILFPELDGNFPNHPADPIQPENLVDLKAAVLAEGADIGLAFDGDADRVFLVDERAEPVSGSLTTALVAASMLKKHPGETILYNLICSHVVPEVVTELGGTADSHPGGSLDHQAGDGRDQRHLRRRTLRPLLLPRQFPRGLGHHYRAPRPGAVERERQTAVRAPAAVPALQRFGGDQYRGAQSRGNGGGDRRTRELPRGRPSIGWTG